VHKALGSSPAQKRKKGKQGRRKGEQRGGREEGRTKCDLFQECKVCVISENKLMECILPME
jgi:hypothetical protein